MAGEDWVTVFQEIIERAKRATLNDLAHGGALALGTRAAPADGPMADAVLIDNEFTPVCLFDDEDTGFDDEEAGFA